MNVAEKVQLYGGRKRGLFCGEVEVEGSELP
jgi:hypothetical protein